VTEGIYYSIFNRPLENILPTLDGKCYYYKDNIPQKIRYIFIDAPSVNSGLSAEEKTWLEARITEVSAGWTIVMFAHAYWEGNDASAVTTVGASIKSCIDEVYDSCPGNIAALITGHNHASLNIKTGKGYQIISTPADSWNWNNDVETPSRTENTTLEQVFDVYSIDTQNKKIYITRVGGSGSDRELTYD
jgi:hypothetical protein